MSGALSLKKYYPRVVPANAGTHTPCHLVLALGQRPSATMSARGYGSRRSPGRRTEMHGAALILSRAKQSRILRLVPHAGEIGAKGCAAEIVERSIQRTLSGCDDDRLEQGQHALTVGLPQRNEPRAGGNP